MVVWLGNEEILFVGTTRIRPTPVECVPEACQFVLVPRTDRHTLSCPTLLSPAREPMMPLPPHHRPMTSLRWSAAEDLFHSFF